MSAQAPMIYSDSMFESEVPTDFAPKLESVDELSCHLPDQGKRQDVMADSCLPILIHTDVMDSVFSTTLDQPDQTPMFDDLDFILDGSKVNQKDDWVSLFKDETQPEGASVNDEDLADLFAEDVKEEPVKVQPSKQLETPMTPMLKTPSLEKKRPRVDSVVSYSKRPRAELPMRPVSADPEDPVALKRARNTEAARRSRARKMEKMTQLEDKVSELTEEKDGLALEVKRLRCLLDQHGIAF